MPSRNHAVIGALAFLSGWADVLCLMRFAAFASMQTGNAVLVGRALSDWEHDPTDAIFNVCIILANMLGNTVHDLIRKKASSGKALALQATAIALATATSDVLDAFFGHSRWHICFVAAAFGAQNALALNDARLGINTTTSARLAAIESRTQPLRSTR